MKEKYKYIHVTIYKLMKNGNQKVYQTLQIMTTSKQGKNDDNLKQK